MSRDEEKADSPLDGLEPKRRDHLVAVAKGLSGVVPGIGPIAAEVIGHVIPQQRLDRVVSVVQLLNEKLKDLDQEIIRARMNDEMFVDLLEDGIHQSARALTEERREHIATLLKNSLASDDLEHLREKKLLWLLGQLDDAELIMLRSYGVPHEQRREFVDRHEAVVRGPSAHLGSDQEELDRATIHEASRRRLRDLGLIRLRFKKPKRGALPEFDEKTGMMKASGNQITPLGRMLLRRLDLPTDI